MNEDKELDDVIAFNKYISTIKLMSEHPDLAERITRDALAKKGVEIENANLTDTMNAAMQYVSDERLDVEKIISQFRLSDEYDELNRVSIPMGDENPVDTMIATIERFSPRLKDVQDDGGEIELGQIAISDRFTPSKVATAVGKALGRTVVPAAITGVATYAMTSAALPVVGALMVRKAATTLVAPHVFKAVSKVFGEDSKIESCARFGAFVKKATSGIKKTLTDRLGISKLTSENSQVMKNVKSFTSKHPNLVKYSIMAATTVLGLSMSTEVMAAAQEMPIGSPVLDAHGAVIDASVHDAVSVSPDVHSMDHSAQHLHVQSESDDAYMMAAIRDAQSHGERLSHDDLVQRMNDIKSADVDASNPSDHPEELYRERIRATEKYGNLTPENTNSVEQPSHHVHHTERSSHPYDDSSVGKKLSQFHDVKLGHLQGGLTEQLKREFAENGIQFTSHADQEKVIEHVLGIVKANNDIDNLDVVATGQTVKFPDMSGLTGEDLVKFSELHNDHVNIYDHSVNAQVDGKPDELASVSDDRMPPAEVTAVNEAADLKASVDFNDALKAFLENPKDAIAQENLSSYFVDGELNSVDYDAMVQNNPSLPSKFDINEIGGLLDDLSSKDSLVAQIAESRVDIVVGHATMQTNLDFTPTEMVTAPLSMEYNQDATIKFMNNLEGLKVNPDSELFMKGASEYLNHYAVDLTQHQELAQQYGHIPTTDELVSLRVALNNTLNGDVVQHEMGEDMVRKVINSMVVDHDNPMSFPKPKL